MAKRRKFTPEFKAEVVLSALGYLTPLEFQEKNLS